MDGPSTSLGAAANNITPPTSVGPSKPALTEEESSRREWYINEFARLSAEVAAAGKVTPPFRMSDDTAVFVRCRPVLPSMDPPEAYRVVLFDGRTVVCHQPRQSVKGVPWYKASSRKVHCAFPTEASNEVVYATVCKPLVELAAGGGSATVIAYGQTGSGKTHTISAMMEQAANDLWDHCTNHTVTVSAVQLLGADCTDLQNANPEEGSNNVVQIKEDKFGNVCMSNVKHVPVTSATELLEQLRKASELRRTESTQKNDVSSRSHMIVRITMKNLAREQSESGCLVLVDLAGSESSKDSTNHNKERMNEMKLINLSLMNIKQCMVSRAKIRQTAAHIHVPYRSNKLTLLLRDCFDLSIRRPVKTVFLACISPVDIDSANTANTLTYAAEVAAAPKQTVRLDDPEDPYCMARDAALLWIEKASGGQCKAAVVLPEGDGRTLSELPEDTFIQRAVLSGMAERAAEALYLELWRMIVDARTRRVGGHRQPEPEPEPEGECSDPPAP